MKLGRGFKYPRVGIIGSKRESYNRNLKMGRLNWEKANKSILPSEGKYDDGKKLSDGRVIIHKKDRLALRAAKAEREWLKKIGKEKI